MYLSSAVMKLKGEVLICDAVDLLVKCEKNKTKKTTDP